MPFRVSGKNIDIGEALRQRVNARLVEALEKYFDRGYSGHVTVEKDGFGFRTECAIHLDSGVTLESEAMAADAYASADQAAIRMEKHCANARHLAAWLATHPAVTKVHYPGLPNHPGHALAKKQMRDFGGMISVSVRGGKDGALKLLTKTKVFSLAESLGGVESLISCSLM